MKALQKTVSLARAATRNPAVCNNIVRFRSTAERDAIRAKFQAPGDTPVFLRGGPKDKILFGITCVLVGSGVCGCIYRIYSRM